MKLIVIERIFGYEDHVYKECYLINLQDFKSLEKDTDPDTGEMRLITKDHNLRGIVEDGRFLKKFISFFSNDEEMFEFTLYDDHYLIPGLQD